MTLASFILFVAMCLGSVSLDRFSTARTRKTAMLWLASFAVCANIATLIWVLGTRGALA